ncbi:hypothetical protein MKK84_21170 [Methylobacterium sp. E-065]|uniref:hypothetical protein n=1 Tax=Methylobacterium sp. E-065 TaxID=2836583 RepID=UPI001FB9A7E4|nr:hypothetical protein [Methylobacterium sp. E-065]MCJ2019914.1 hypothetical protein [Methylobacterium sp. E-065]
MTFKASDELPRLSWRDLHAVNAMVKPDDGSKPLNDLRMHHRRWMERGLMCAISASQFMVLSAIVARTFAWMKAIEVIPLTVFTDGMRDPNDPNRHATDDEGMPFFIGTGLGTSTVRRALAELAEKRLIDRFQVPTSERNTYAYMPVSALTLYFALAASPTADVDDFPHGIMNYLRVTRDMAPLEELFTARWVEETAPAEATHAA